MKYAPDPGPAPAGLSPIRLGLRGSTGTVLVTRSCLRLAAGMYGNASVCAHNSAVLAECAHVLKWACSLQNFPVGC